MPRRDAEAVGIGQSADRRGLEDGPLLFEMPYQPVGDAGDLLPAEDADEVVDVGPLNQQIILLPLGQAARDDDATGPSLPLEVEKERTRVVTFSQSGVGTVASSKETMQSSVGLVRLSPLA